MDKKIEELIDCGELHSKSVKEEDLVGEMSIADLLQQPFEKHIGSFEVAETIKQLLDVDEINAVVTWYLKWKLTEPIDTQNTCTIKRIFGFNDGIRAIVAINFYKYLRNKGYDPNVMEKFVSKQ